MEKIKIVLSDSFVLFREGIHFVISGEENLDVVGETNDNSNLFDNLITNPADIVVIGITEDWQKDLNIICRIKRNMPSVSVILVLNEVKIYQIITAIACDISAYLTRESSEINLIDVITQITIGKLPIINDMLVPDIASEIINNFIWIDKLSNDIKVYLSDISSRETEILTEISSGKDIHQVAEKMNSGEEDIRNELESIRKKLVANYISKLLIENVQGDLIVNDLPVEEQTSKEQEHPSVEYITKKEFSEFKESLKKVIDNCLNILKDFS